LENRGENRERNLEKSAYYSDNYFGLTQLCSFAHQIHDIHRLKPANILEIGIGNGFTSSFLKRAGFDVVTVDINAALEPDICSPIAGLVPHLKGRYFDLVVCCEVLEHMPFENFETNIEVFRAAGSRLYLTLPNYKRVFGLGGFLRLPKLSPTIFGAQIELGIRKPLDKEHFWEVGSSSMTTRKEILNTLGKFYSHVNTRRYGLNPYHLSFQASNA
jgi:SAM-dependent methyltransferase